MRTFRIISQSVFLLIFLILFFFINKYPLAYKIDSDFFLKLNPLTTLLVTIASHKVILNLLILSGIVVLISTLLGRVFCGFVCPLGAMIDFTDKVFSKARSSRRRPPIYFHRLKYIFLIILLICAVFGVLIPLFMDPIPLVTRIFTFLIDPFIRIFLSGSEHSISYISQSFSDYLYLNYSVKQPLYYGGSLTFLMVLIIFGGTFWDKRFWCQYVCPTGAFLGLISRFSLFRRKINEEKCNSCAACAKVCPVRAISDKNIKKISSAECISCGLCVEIKDHCCSFSIGGKSVGIEPVHIDCTRRHLVAGLAGGALLVPVVGSNAITRRDDHGRLIRPPGAVPEQEFLKKCIACGECMKVCPANSLQPSMFTDGFDRLYTPKVVPRIGGCEAKCAVCGHVCPTGAIRKLTSEDKPFVKIGTAVLDKHRCIAWDQNKECVVCDESCPYNAIDTRELQTTGGMFKVPVVKADLCMGCGVCEQNCPVGDFAAITVYRFGENRKSDGPYMTEWQKKSFAERRLLTGQEKSSYPGSSSNSQDEQKNSDSNSNSDSKLPEGFE
jgi:MauM/NapG family ferredoxin protein